MTTSYKERLPGLTTLIFDVDGVFTDGTVIVMPDGQLLRRLSARDSYALQYAVKKGYTVAIITGGNSMAVSDSFQRLGVQHIYLESSDKLKVYNSLIEKLGVSDREVLYMGDDIPDYEVLCRVGVSACPHDACIEVRQVAHYVSDKNGGEGCVRDIIEQTLRVQGKWFDHEAHHW
jgi:3-deoxy-D-manno-octulosonate 8-phosphate phosphatase (KDO 8-P phosphatase)